VTEASNDPDERRVRALAEGLRRAIAEGMSDQDLGAVARAVLDGPEGDKRKPDKAEERGAE
jgi:hypothetical protein